VLFDLRAAVDVRPPSTSNADVNIIRCMRTTLNIETPILKQLRELQRREGGSLGALVSRLLADALAGRGKRTAPAFRWTSRPTRSLVDLADKDAVYAILDRPDREAEP
jgi:hypothetical protein